MDSTFLQTALDMDDEDDGRERRSPQVQRQLGRASRRRLVAEINADRTGRVAGQGAKTRRSWDGGGARTGRGSRDELPGGRSGSLERPRRASPGRDEHRGSATASDDDRQDVSSRGELQRGRTGRALRSGEGTGREELPGGRTAGFERSATEGRGGSPVGFELHGDSAAGSEPRKARTRRNRQAREGDELQQVPGSPRFEPDRATTGTREMRGTRADRYRG